MYTTRISRTVSVVALASLAAGCLGQIDPDGAEPAGVTTRADIGAPCVPAIEDEPSFGGFNEREVAIETKSRSCSSGVCLVNHFRGRVSCPYGEATKGGCRTPRGIAVDAGSFSAVEAQCADRRPEVAVHCSCRCANALGRTDDGASYCACGAGFVCESLIAPVPGEDALAGSYCVRAAALPSTCGASCSPDDPSARCDE